MTLAASSPHNDGIHEPVTDIAVPRMPRITAMCKSLRRSLATTAAWESTGEGNTVPLSAAWTETPPIMEGPSTTLCVLLVWSRYGRSGDRFDTARRTGVAEADTGVHRVDLSIQYAGSCQGELDK